MISPVNNINGLRPYETNNYCTFNQKKVDFFVSNGKNSLPYLNQIILYSYNEQQLTETLYILDRLIDKGTPDIEKMYPSLSRLNGTNSPYIQTFLAGIYRKIQVPDAFGPLVAMLIRNSVQQKAEVPFDPNEEIGGAVLSYLT